MPASGLQTAVERHAGRAGEGAAAIRGAIRPRARIHRHAGGDAAAGGAAVDLPSPNTQRLRVGCGYPGGVSSVRMAL